MMSPFHLGFKKRFRVQASSGPEVKWFKSMKAAYYMDFCSVKLNLLLIELPDYLQNPSKWKFSSLPRWEGLREGDKIVSIPPTWSFGYLF